MSLQLGVEFIHIFIELYFEGMLSCYVASEPEVVQAELAIGMAHFSIASNLGASYFKLCDTCMGRLTAT